VVVVRGSLGTGRPSLALLPRPLVPLTSRPFWTRDAVTNGARRLTPVVRLLMTDAFLLVALTLVPLIAAGWWGYGRAMEDVAQARTIASLSLMRDALEMRFTRYRQSADGLAGICRTGVVACNHADLPKALVALAPEEGSFRSLGVVFADGTAVDVAPKDGGLLTEACVQRSRVITCEDATWRWGGTLLHATTDQSGVGRFDPRERDWYKTALTREEGRWGVPFLQQADGALINRYRMTYSVRIAEKADAAHAGAVAEVAVSLDELLADVRALQPSPTTLTFIVDAQGHPVLLPDMAPFRGIEATPTNRPISPEFLPVADAFLSSSQGGGPVSVSGKEYYPAHVQFAREPGIDWVITMALPAAEVLGGPRTVAYVMIPVALLVIALACARAARLARRFSRPLRDLARTTGTLVEGEIVALPDTEIAEIHEVGERFVRASSLIRERARLESELFHAQRVATIGALAGGIVHDLNNQLSVVVGTLGTLQASGAYASELRVISEAVASSVELTRGILAFSRGGPALRKTELDANVLVANVARLLAGTLRSSRLIVRSDLAPDLPGLHGDRVLLEQVLTNLALNARDAMPDGGTLTFSTRATPEGQVSIAVIDTGRGIPPEVREHVLEAFFTTKRVGEGTGLGLSMVRGIVAIHDGTLTIDSVLGQGSTFTVLLAALPQSVGKVRAP